MNVECKNTQLNTLSFVLLKYPSVASTFMEMTWQDNCEMPKRRAKSGILLAQHLIPGLIKENNTVQTNMTATPSKGPKKEFLWKGHNRSDRRKKLPNNKKKL